MCHQDEIQTTIVIEKIKQMQVHETGRNSENCLIQLHETVLTLKQPLSSPVSSSGPRIMILRIKKVITNSS